MSNLGAVTEQEAYQRSEQLLEHHAEYDGYGDRSGEVGHREYRAGADIAHAAIEDQGDFICFVPAQKPSGEEAKSIAGGGHQHNDSSQAYQMQVDVRQVRGNNRPVNHNHDSHEQFGQRV
ncbi:hypothetical protein D3C81_1657970 [compost metagenome]